MSKIFPLFGPSSCSLSGHRAGRTCKLLLACGIFLVRRILSACRIALRAGAVPFFLLLAAMAVPAGAAAQSAPGSFRVVVSIKPLHALVSGVMQGVAAPRLLIAGASSPHQFSLRPSMAAMLEQADVVFWIGPELEPFLADPLKNLAPDALRIPLARLAAPRMQADDSDTSADPHVWLDPEIAADMVALIAEKLALIDPDNAAIYSRNAAGYRQELARLRADIETQLAPVRNIPFMTFHEAYTHFNRRFGLNSLGAITLGPERRPGARRVREVQALIRDENVRCVFAEPQFDASLVFLVIGKSPARSGVLDPLGSDLQPGAEMYFELMQDLARSLLECLGS